MMQAESDSVVRFAPRFERGGRLRLEVPLSEEVSEGGGFMGFRYVLWERAGDDGFVVCLGVGRVLGGQLCPRSGFAWWPV